MITALQGVRVLDLTRMVAGPYAALLLADLGAEVIKLERPGAGDEVRAIGPHFAGGESVYFMAINRAKKSVSVDLSVPEGRAVMHDLARRCDVLVENFRYGVAERVGCDYDTLKGINPRLIVCGMTAFGRTGPDRELPAFDLTLQARGGTMGLTGTPGGEPTRMGPPMGDLAGGMYAAMAIGAALYERERTGRGRFIDLSLLDCQVSLLTYAGAFWLNAGAVLGPQGSAHPHAIPYQTFPTRDVPIAVAVFTDRFWAPFCRALGEPAWGDDARYATARQRRALADELLPAIATRTCAHPAEHWLAALYREGVPAAPVQTVDRVFSDPQVLARGMVVQTEHPAAGPIRTADSPFKPEPGEHPLPSPPPPRLGEHTDLVLRELAGYDAERVNALRARGVIA